MSLAQGDHRQAGMGQQGQTNQGRVAFHFLQGNGALEGLKGADLDRYPGLIRACGGVRKGGRIDLHDAYHCFLGHAMVKKRLIALLHGFEIQFGLVIANPIPGSYLLPA